VQSSPFFVGLWLLKVFLVDYNCSGILLYDSETQNAMELSGASDPRNGCESGIGSDEARLQNAITRNDFEDDDAIPSALIFQSSYTRIF
jgi:hypothetical protein